VQGLYDFEDLSGRRVSLVAGGSYLDHLLFHNPSHGLHSPPVGFLRASGLRPDTQQVRDPPGHNSHRFSSP